MKGAMALTQSNTAISIQQLLAYLRMAINAAYMGRLRKKGRCVVYLFMFRSTFFELTLGNQMGAKVTEVSWEITSPHAGVLVT